MIKETFGENMNLLTPATKDVKTFEINVPQEVLNDLKERLARTRWTDQVEGAGWDYGTNLEYIKELTNYWQNQYDWRKQEAILNGFAQFRVAIDGFGIHFIHERGKGPEPMPIIISHGWPSSFSEMVKIIPLLTDPGKYGGDPADSFDVVVPSLPGFGFSDRPGQRGMNLFSISDLWAKLMTDVLGYKKFAAAGGDIGCLVTKVLAQTHSEPLIGIHLIGTGLPLGNIPTDLSEAEKQYLGGFQQWAASEGAYSMLQSTKPQTLSYGLNDSPVGLAAWIIEKFRAWSDCNGEVEKRFSKDELLNNIMVYWLTGTIGSSVRTYFEMSQPSPLIPKMAEFIKVPTGVIVFPKDLGAMPPKEWGERCMNIPLVSINFC